MLCQEEKHNREVRARTGDTNGHDVSLLTHTKREVSSAPHQAFPGVRYWLIDYQVSRLAAQSLEKQRQQTPVPRERSMPGKKGDGETCE